MARAKEGYIALEQWVKRTLHEPRTAGSDGAFVTLWRLLVQYPEILAWQKQWFLSQEEVYALIYGTVKTINADAQVGWHSLAPADGSRVPRAPASHRALRIALDCLDAEIQKLHQEAAFAA